MQGVGCRVQGVRLWGFGFWNLRLLVITGFGFQFCCLGLGVGDVGCRV